jgi:hypothetical protein
MPKSLAFEFYLMNLLLEQNMNSVNKKICHRARQTSSSWQKPTASTPGWTDTRNLLYKRPSPGAQVAQLVEQRTENPCVGGSIPPLGTIASQSSVSRRIPALAASKGLDDMDGNNFRYEYRTYGARKDRIQRLHLK